MNKRLYLFYIGHPAHYYSSMTIADRLSDNGHSILFICRAKDIVLDLMKECPYNYKIISSRERGKSIFGIILSVLIREVKLFFIALKYHPYVMIGTDIVISHIGKLLNIPSVILNEDDESIVPLLAKYGFKYSTVTISPKSCKFNNYKHKKIEYNGFHKMLYLNPHEYHKRFKNFTSDVDITSRYFLLRFSGLTAHHDSRVLGIDDDVATQLIKKLSSYGKIYISSEKKLNEDMSRYLLDVNPKDMHFYLANCDFLISDSQSMSVEASMLGVPSIRYSSFAGKIGVLNELENDYKLTFAITPGDTWGLFSKIDELLSIIDIKSEFQLRRQKLYDDKINVTSFFVWILENLPESIRILKQNPEYQNRFI